MAAGDNVYQDVILPRVKFGMQTIFVDNKIDNGLESDLFRTCEGTPNHLYKQVEYYAKGVGNNIGVLLNYI